MKVFCCVLLLVAGLAFSSSTPTKEECDKVLQVLSLSDRTKLYGKTNFIMGYSNHEVHNAVLRHLNSATMDIAAAEHDDNGVVMTQELKVNEACVHTVINITIEGDVGIARDVMHFASSQFQLYEIANGTMAVRLNNTHKEPQKFLKLMSVNSHYAGEEELTTQCLYLISTEKSLDEAKLDHFKKQAACLGFPDEPSFVYDGKTEMCGLPQSKSL